MNKRNVSCIIAYVLFVSCIIYAVNPVFTRKEDLRPWNSFYSQTPQSIEIVILGSSVLADAINPYLLSSETNYKTFNMALSAQVSSLRKPILKELCKTQNIKIAIIESYRYINALSDMTMSEINHGIGGMHFSLNKLDTLRHVHVKDGSDYDKIEALIPLLGYHNRWDQLSIEDTFSSKTYKSTLNWWPDNTSSDAHPQIPSCTTTKIGTIHDSQKKGLDEIIQYAQKNNITLLFFNPPIPAFGEEFFSELNALYAYLDENKIAHVDCNYDEAFLRQIDYSQDFLDDRHVNLSGAQKTTFYLANYITNHYGNGNSFNPLDPDYQYYLDYYN